MDHDQQFLSFIHKNAAMGVSAIPQVLSLPQSRAMGQALNIQLQEYRTIAAQSQAYARKHGARLHTPGLTVRAMSGAMLKARTAADHTTSKLAQLMIQGSTMGTVEMTRRIHQYTGKADPELLALTSRAFRLYALSFVIMGFNVYASSFFTALGDGVTSALISFLRTLVFQIAAVLILPAILGIDGIWLAVTAAELAALAVSAAMFVTKDKVFHYRKA